MEEGIIISSLALALGCIIPWYKLQTYKKPVIGFLLFSVLFGSAIEGFKDGSGGGKLVIALILILLVNHFISGLIEKKWSVALGLVSSLSLFFWQGTELNFLDYPVLFTKENALFIALFASLMPIIIELKVTWLSKSFAIERKDLSVALHFLGIGILSQGALFFGGAFGLFLAAFGYFLSEMYLRKIHFSLLLVVLSFLNYFFQLKGIDTGTLLQGNVLLGLFSGFGIAYLLSSTGAASKPLPTALLLLASSMLIVMLIFVGLVKEHMGGMSAFAGLMIAYLAISFRFKEERSAYFLYLLSFTLAVGVYGSSKFSGGPKGKPAQNEMNTDFEASEGIQLPGEIEEKPLAEENAKASDTVKKPVNPLLGAWKINPEASKLTFELGPPEARTQGEFGKINGTFLFTDQLKTNKISVELPLKFFTTYNDYRDESLFSKDFLDVEQQPVLTFESLSWKQKQKKYVVEGNFRMKGITEKVLVELKIVSSGADKKGEYLSVSGLTVIDRTKFAMSSDPKIGDLVDTRFQLELRKK